MNDTDKFFLAQIGIIFAVACYLVYVVEFLRAEPTSDSTGESVCTCE